MDNNQIHVLGCKINLVKKQEIYELCEKMLDDKKCNHIVTLNPEIALKGEKDEKFRAILNNSDLIICDGVGLKLGAFLLGAPIPHRIMGREIVDELIKLSLNRNLAIYLLGGENDVSIKSQKELEKKYPGIRIVGAEQGMKKNSFSFNNIDLINRINKSKASIILIAFGAPKQEIWIHRNKKYLDNAKIAVGIGGIFDYISQNVKNPPRTIQKLGLEWIFRLFTQKRRLKRIINAAFIFPVKCVIWRLRMLLLYRKNVLAVIINDNNEILLVSPFWSEKILWQFPQGGINKNETKKQAIFREMKEELGTDKFEILDFHDGVYRYMWPKWYRRLRGYKGQKQDLFILNFIGKNKDINIRINGEISKWKWFNRNEYLRALSPARKKVGNIVDKILQKL